MSEKIIPHFNACQHVFSKSTNQHIFNITEKCLGFNEYFLTNGYLA